MVSLTEEQKDAIYNCLAVGMAPEDAFLFAKLSAEEINWIADDEDMQFWLRHTQKQLEFGLLTEMKRGAERQIAVGKTEATQWLLERLFPRYSQKATPDTGTINLIVRKNEDTSDIESIVGGQ